MRFFTIFVETTRAATIVAICLGFATSNLSRAATACVQPSTAPLPAGAWDNSGNSLLNGQYYFRYVRYTIGDQLGDLSQAQALSQSITFTSASGTYSIANGSLLDSKIGSTAQTESYNGSYAISGCGFGFISNPLSPSDLIWGGVGQSGTFVGSTTEPSKMVIDLFIAIPVSAAGNSALTGNYSIGYLNFPDGLVADIVAAGFQMAPNGAGSIGTVNIQFFQGIGPATDISEQASYSLTNGTGTLTLSGLEESISSSLAFFVSADGNFIFGGSTKGYDFFLGVRTSLASGQSTVPFSPSNFGGMYYQAGIDQIMSSTGGSPQSYYGAFEALSGVILDHQRILAPLAGTVTPGYPPQAVSFTYQDSYSLAFDSNGGYTDAATSKQFVIGGNGAVRLAFGVPPALGIGVAISAPNAPAPSTVYINPAGVVNAASYAPFTAGISPGELIEIYGSNLAPAGTANSSSTSVTVNGIVAQIVYTSPTMIVAIVPTNVSLSSSSIQNPQYAQIQVTNARGVSNTVTAVVHNTTPGVLTQAENGLGQALALVSNSPVTSLNPVTAGQTVTLFLTGLGEVTAPAGVGSLTPGQYTPMNNITASIGGKQVPIVFPSLPQALSPQATGVNQIEVTIPSGLSGAVPLIISSPDSQAAQTTIAVGGGATPSAIKRH